MTQKEEQSLAAQLLHELQEQRKSFETRMRALEGEMAWLKTQLTILLERCPAHLDAEEKAEDEREGRLRSLEDSRLWARVALCFIGLVWTPIMAFAVRWAAKYFSG